jgi:ABC-type sulfate transport system permease component
MLLFNITTHYSLWFLPLCVLCGLFFSYLLYRFKAPTKDVSPKIINLLFVIRTLLISALLFFLLEPFIKRIVNEKEKPIIILAQDNSASLINTKDSAYYRKEYLE